MVTNPGREVLYTGMTNDLKRRLTEHLENRGNVKTFAGKYYCYKLVYFERHYSALAAIEREKEIKKWSRKKKDALIKIDNPGFKSLNAERLEF